MYGIFNYRYYKVIFLFSAVNWGSDLLELDCHLTADGHVVVSHDNDLQRCTGHDQLISETKLQVIFIRLNQR